MGKSEAKNLTVRIDGKQPGQEWQNAHASEGSLNLAGGQTFGVVCEYEIPNNAALQFQLSFQISLKFLDANNKTVEKVINAKWTSDHNVWSYE
jgi:hypothetical protein